MELTFDVPLTLYITETCCQNITAIHRPWRKFCGGICRYKTFRMRIFERTTFLLFRCCSIHVKLEVTIARELLPYDLHLDLLITKGPTDVNIVHILHLSNSFESKHWFTSTANQLNSVRYSVGTSYFTKHKIPNIYKAFVHIKDFFYPSLSQSKS